MSDDIGRFEQGLATSDPGERSPRQRTDAAAAFHQNGSDAPAAPLQYRRVLIDGVWHERISRAEAPGWPERATPFRRWVTADAGSGFPAEAGRYHLYVSYGCPFAHRTILARALGGLEEVVSISVLHPHLAGPEGWTFARAAPDRCYPEVTDDPVNGKRFLHEVYRVAHPLYTGRVTVPVLWDRRTATMVSNDSGDILRMLSTALARLGTREADLFPVGLADEIESMNGWLSRRVNEAVYRVGLAADQATYDREVEGLFGALDDLEPRLARRRFLVGDRLTEADLRLFVTLIRLDVAYSGALWCNLRRLADYPGLLEHTRRLYRRPEIRRTVKFDHIRRHYFDDGSFVGRRPAGTGERILPAGPHFDAGPDALHGSAPGEG